MRLYVETPDAGYRLATKEDLQESKKSKPIITGLCGEPLEEGRVENE